MKATLTKETIDKLYSISNLTNFCVLERTIRLSCLADTLKFGTTLVDIPENFYLPINNLSQFISMCENVRGKNNFVDVEYNTTERELGLDVKTLYDVTISNDTQEFKLYTAMNSDIESIINDDKSDKTKEIKPQPEYIKCQLTPSDIKIIDSNIKLLDADTILFRHLEKTNTLKIKVYDSKLPDPSYFDFKIKDAEFHNMTEFYLTTAMFKKLDFTLIYDVILSPRGCLFANKETSTFYIIGTKKKPKFDTNE